MEAATCPARLRSDLAAAAGSRLGSAKEPTITTHWRRPVRCQHHFSVLSVRPHDARARARVEDLKEAMHSALPTDTELLQRAIAEIENLRRQC